MKDTLDALFALASILPEGVDTLRPVPAPQLLSLQSTAGRYGTRLDSVLGFRNLLEDIVTVTADLDRRLGLLGEGSEQEKALETLFKYVLARAHRISETCSALLPEDPFWRQWADEWRRVVDAARPTFVQLTNESLAQIVEENDEQLHRYRATISRMGEAERSAVEDLVQVCRKRGFKRWLILVGLADLVRGAAERPDIGMEEIFEAVKRALGRIDLPGALCESDALSTFEIEFTQDVRDSGGSLVAAFREMLARNLRYEHGVAHPAPESVEQRRRLAVNEPDLALVDIAGDEQTTAELIEIAGVLFEGLEQKLSAMRLLFP